MFFVLAILLCPFAGFIKAKISPGFFLRRFRVAFLCDPVARLRRFFGAAARALLVRLCFFGAARGFVRARCFALARCAFLPAFRRFVFSAARCRFVPKNLICFAVMFPFLFRRAGFAIITSLCATAIHHLQPDGMRPP